MDAKNRKGPTAEEVMEMVEKMGNVATIDTDLIERGFVLKSSVYYDEDCEVALLMLSPNAKIKKHKHVNDSEYYFMVKDNLFVGCKKGESHELENLSDEWLPVISIKYKE